MTNLNFIHIFQATKISATVPGFMTVYCFNAVNSKLEISHTNGTVNYIETDTSDRVILNVAVLLGVTASPVQLSQRRNNLFRKLSDEASREDMVKRCSIAAGACFHTMEEIAYLHDDIHHDAGSLGRKLQVAHPDTSQPVMNYAEVTADTAVMNKAGLSNFADIQKFVENVLGGLPTQTGSTYHMALRVRERCANYEDLAPKCNSVPVCRF